MKTPHKQVAIQWGDLRAEVDYKIAPLILALWKLGIHTVNSCQENRPRTAWIEFLTTDDAKQFLGIVAVYPDEEDEKEPFWETLYGRITQCGSANDWEYHLHPFNWNVHEEIVSDEVIETCIGPSDFEFSVSIRFPKKDIPLLVKLLEGIDE